MEGSNLINDNCKALVSLGLYSLTNNTGETHMKQKLINLAINTVLMVSLALAFGYLFAVALTQTN